MGVRVSGVSGSAAEMWLAVASCNLIEFLVATF